MKKIRKVKKTKETPPAAKRGTSTRKFAKKSTSIYSKVLAAGRKKSKGKDEFHQLQELSKNLPFSYNETKLILLARDPVWGYTYWDFSAKTWNWIKDLCKWNPELQAVLRIYNLTENKKYEVAVSLEAKNWYISLGKPNCEFEAELGLLGSDGKFYRIAKSNRIRTPRNSPADIIDPQWAPEDFDELYKLSGGDLKKQSSDLSSQFKKRTR